MIRNKTIRLLTAGTALACVLAVAPPALAADPDRPVSHQVSPPQETNDQLSSRLPSFGGLFLKDDAVHVYMTEPADEATVREAIEEAMGKEFLAGRTIVIVQAEYTYTQLQSWFKPEIMAIPGVVTSGVSDGENRLLVGVRSEADVQAVRAELGKMGIPPEAVNVEVTAEVTTMALPLPDSAGREIATESAPAPKKAARGNSFALWSAAALAAGGVAGLFWLLRIRSRAHLPGASEHRV